MVRRAILSLTVAVLALACARPAQASTAPGWHVQSVIGAGAGVSAALFAVTADAPGDAWAVGWHRSTSDRSFAPLIARWNGSAWTQVTLPARILSSPSGSGFLPDSVSASSPRNVWAFGDTTAWVHFDGIRWSTGQLVKSHPGGQVIINSVLALSKTDVWAFGARLRSGGPESAYAAHLDGTRWTATPVPGSGLIVAGSAVAAGDVWAVEGTASHLRPGPDAGALVHWSGKKWRAVRLPKALANPQLSSVFASSDSNVWVGGAVSSGVKKGTTETVGHWNGRSWTVTRLPAAPTRKQFEVTGLASDGHGGLWAIGNCDLCFSSVLTRVWHESAGTWTRAPVTAKDPVGIASMARIPGTTSVWGAGDILADKSQRGLITLDGPAPR
jgi:hypothetical protein